MKKFITLSETLVSILQEVHESRDLGKLECVVRVVRRTPISEGFDALEKAHLAALDRSGRSHDPELDISEAMREHRATYDKLRRRKPPRQMFLGPTVYP